MVIDFDGEKNIIQTMQAITFITGNQKKADYLAKYLGFPIEHMKIDLDEIQSLDLREIVEHKVKQAYAKVGKPVVVDDVWLEFCALGRLPWPFTKFFQQEISFQDMCDLLNWKDRKAIARCGYGYYDEKGFVYFENALEGRIAEEPKWNDGFWWDQIFVPIGDSQTAAELGPDEYEVYYKKVKPIEKLRDFLMSL